MKRTPLQRRTRLRAKYPAAPFEAFLKPANAKRQKQLDAYWPLQRKFLEANPICQRCQVRRSTDLHHARGRRGALLLDERWFKALCRQCHSHVTEHPREALEQGWSLPRIGRAA